MSSSVLAAVEAARAELAEKKRKSPAGAVALVSDPSKKRRSAPSSTSSRANKARFDQYIAASQHELADRRATAASHTALEPKPMTGYEKFISNCAIVDHSLADVTVDSSELDRRRWNLWLSLSNEERNLIEEAQDMEIKAWETRRRRFDRESQSASPLSLDTARQLPLPAGRGQRRNSTVTPSSDSKSFTSPTFLADIQPNTRSIVFPSTRCDLIVRMLALDSKFTNEALQTLSKATESFLQWLGLAASIVANEAGSSLIRPRDLTALINSEPGLLWLRWALDNENLDFETLTANSNNPRSRGASRKQVPLNDDNEDDEDANQSEDGNSDSNEENGGSEALADSSSQPLPESPLTVVATGAAMNGDGGNGAESPGSRSSEPLVLIKT